MSERRGKSVESTLEEMPDEKIYLEDSDPWAPKMLNLEGTLRLLAMIGDAVDEIGGGSLAQGEMRVARLIRSLQKESLVQLISLATRQDMAWIEENWDFARASMALAGFWKINRIGDLLGQLGVGLGLGREREEIGA